MNLKILKLWRLIINRLRWKIMKNKTSEYAMIALNKLRVFFIHLSGSVDEHGGSKGGNDASKLSSSTIFCFRIWHWCVIGFSLLKGPRGYSGLFRKFRRSKLRWQHERVRESFGAIHCVHEAHIHLRRFEVLAAWMLVTFSGVSLLALIVAPLLSFDRLSASKREI